VLLAVAGFASQAMVRSADSLLPQIAGDFGVTVGDRGQEQRPEKLLRIRSTSTTAGAY
jgi:hypothetical protein